MHANDNPVRMHASSRETVGSDFSKGKASLTIAVHRLVS